MRTAYEGRIHSPSKPIRSLIFPAYFSLNLTASIINRSWRGRRGASDFYEIRLVLFLSKRMGENTSSGYLSSSESRGMCSVNAKVCIPRAIAVSMISSKLSFAWPGQNCPEWLCIEKAMIRYKMRKVGKMERFQASTDSDKG